MRWICSIILTDLAESMETHCTHYTVKDLLYNLSSQLQPTYKRWWSHILNASLSLSLREVILICFELLQFNNSKDMQLRKYLVKYKYEVSIWYCFLSILPVVVMLQTLQKSIFRLCDCR